MFCYYYNIKVAVKRIVGAKWGLCNGQACIGVDYVVVEHEIAHSVVYTNNFFTNALSNFLFYSLNLQCLLLLLIKLSRSIDPVYSPKFIWPNARKSHLVLGKFWSLSDWIDEENDKGNLWWKSKRFELPLPNHQQKPLWEVAQPYQRSPRCSFHCSWWFNGWRKIVTSQHLFWIYALYVVSSSVQCIHKY